MTKEGPREEVDFTPMVEKALADALKDVPQQIERYVKEAVAEAAPDAVKNYLKEYGTQALDQYVKKSVAEAVGKYLKEHGVEADHIKGRKGGKVGEPEPYIARDLVIEVVGKYFAKGGEGYKLLEGTKAAAVDAGRKAGAEAGGKAIDSITKRVGIKGANVPEDAQLAEIVADGLKAELDRRGVGGDRDEIDDFKSRLEAAEGGMEEFLKGFKEGGKVYNWMRELERRLGALEDGTVDRTNADSEEHDQDVDDEGSDRTNGKKKKHGKK